MADYAKLQAARRRAQRYATDPEYRERKKKQSAERQARVAAYLRERLAGSHMYKSRPRKGGQNAKEL